MTRWEIVWVRLTV
jgi:hypothetical protein